MQKKLKVARLTIAVEPEMKAEIEQQAQANERSVAQQIVFLLKKAMKQQEEQPQQN